jgi:hypothetical protein
MLKINQIISDWRTGDVTYIRGGENKGELGDQYSCQVSQDLHWRDIC